MSLTTRIILCNAVAILLAVAAISAANPGCNALFNGAVGVLLLAVTSALYVVFIRRLFRPLSSFVAALERAAGGDLTVRAEVVGADEFGRLATAFNTMMTDMNGALRQFFSVADLVRDSVVMVRSTTEAMASAAEEVAMQSGTIATASEEMAATSGDIARNCLYAAENAQKATEQTHSGSQIVQKSAELMDAIARRVNESSRTVEGLGQRSDQIGAIVNTIQDIADQTNLLALNAAIEAARAGEQGRGFAVVADEVRALAERTTKATKEISVMIGNIQGETRTAVSSMVEGVEQVRQGTEETSRSGEALEDILSRINELAMQVSQIATAAEEQTATTSEITQNIQMISDVVTRNVESAHGTTVATAKLAEQVDQLHELVSRFRLSNALEWDSSFSTGIERFDREHQTLFRMVNELHDAMQQKRSKEAIGQILNGLADYTVNHFSGEEEAFSRFAYPDAAPHKQAHQNLVEQVVALQERFRSGQTLLTQDVISFLQGWLTNHIKGTDKKYGPHLKKSGVT